MNSNEKELLLAKIESLMNSIADVQLQQVVRLLWEVTNHATINNKGTFGFGTSSTDVDKTVS